MEKVIGEMRVIISAGGTGGHIYPAISIINKIKEKEPKSEFLYIGTTDRMESQIIPNLNIPYIGIPMLGLKKDFSCFKSMYLFIKAISKCRYEIKKFNPDIVIGVGGYITTPVIYSANKLGYKTVIHEQNSIPGKSNRFLARYAMKIMVSLPGSINCFDKEKTILTGNPRSEEALHVKSINKKDYGLSDNKRLVLIVMGSLGSLTINNELKKIIPDFKGKEYEIVIVTGNDYYEQYHNLKIPANVKIVPYLNNMLNVLPKVDLIVTRAGASMIAEITALGIPSILVPSPYVANNHQYHNAMELVNAKASILLEEKAFNANNLLKDIDLILNDKVLYKDMRLNTLQFGIKDSSERIYKVIRNIIE